MTMRQAGRLLIAVGVMVWAVYAVVWLAGGEPDVGRFVPFHLAGVIPGAIMSRWRRRGGAGE